MDQSALLRPVLVRCRTTDGVDWQPFTRSLPIDSLAVYRVSIAAFGAAVPALSAMLNPDERVRAGRYHQAKDQQRFVVARGALRLLVSLYTGQPPAEIEFAAGINKKPVIVGRPDLHYNVSHAGDWVLIAVSPAPVGVDIEQTNPDFAYQPIVRENFSRAEQQYINESSDGWLCFYRLWTRKEALTKATAKGLDDDVCRIPSLDGTHSIAGELLQTTEDWTVASFIPVDGYMAAVAYPAAGVPEMPVFYAVDPGAWNTIQGHVERY